MTSVEEVQAGSDRYFPQVDPDGISSPSTTRMPNPRSSGHEYLSLLESIQDHLHCLWSGRSSSRSSVSSSSTAYQVLIFSILLPGTLPHSLEATHPPHLPWANIHSSFMVQAMVTSPGCPSSSKLPQHLELVSCNKVESCALRTMELIVH